MSLHLDLRLKTLPLPKTTHVALYLRGWFCVLCAKDFHRRLFSLDTDNDHDQSPFPLVVMIVYLQCLPLHSTI